MPTIKLKTPAKVNLILSILNKRLDNFHEIETIFQAVSLFDIITVDYKESFDTSIKIKTKSSDIPVDSENIVYKATEKFLAAANIRADIIIKITKHIPVAAGLAGGSSDAACVLKALNKLTMYPLKQDIINRIALSLGADVSFFIKGGTAVGKGIGDVLQPVSSPDLNIIIVKHKTLQIRAAWAYEKYDLLSIPPTPKRIFDVLSAIEHNNIDLIAKNLFNSLEYPVLREYPELKGLKEQLIKAGCLNAIVSGSGPALFGIAPDQQKAQEILTKFNPEVFDLWHVKTLQTEARIS